MRNIIVIIMFFSSSVYSQLSSDSQDDVLVTFKGIIQDSQSDLPLPYSFIILEEIELYSVSDEEGYFNFTVPSDAPENTLVKITSTGYKEKVFFLKDIGKIIELESHIEELDEILITGYILTPGQVLKKAIQNIDINNPDYDFNYTRYSDIHVNNNNKDELDLELVTIEYDQGYSQLKRPTRKINQIKWNINKLKDSYNHTSSFFGFRENAIQYASVLNKSSKKFNLKFVNSEDDDDDNIYILKFNIESKDWKYTNRTYPTNYSGLIYIQKDNFAITKLTQNWQTTLRDDDIVKYESQLKSDSDDSGRIVELKIREENTCYYTRADNEKYYATKYFHKIYTDKLTNLKNIRNSYFESQSSLYDFKTNDIVKFPSKPFNKNTTLQRVKYNKDFWGNFQSKITELKSENTHTN